MVDDKDKEEDKPKARGRRKGPSDLELISALVRNANWQSPADAELATEWLEARKEEGT
jgi:hypothetical protein